MKVEPGVPVLTVQSQVSPVMVRMESPRVEVYVPDSVSKSYEPSRYIMIIWGFKNFHLFFFKFLFPVFLIFILFRSVLADSMEVAHALCDYNYDIIFHI